MLVTEGRWWKREADRVGCSVSILCCAEIDLTFKSPALSDFLSSIKLSRVNVKNLLQPATKTLVS